MPASRPQHLDPGVWLVLSSQGRSTSKLSQGDGAARLRLILGVGALILAAHAIISLVTQAAAVSAEGPCFKAG